MCRELHPTSDRGFTALIWNVLADGLAESGWFLHSPLEALHWACRGDTIVRPILSGEVDWTTWKVQASGEVRRTIDYVFFSPNTLRLMAVLSPPAPEEIDQDRLPSWRYPSDHLNLLVRFERR